MNKSALLSVAGAVAVAHAAAPAQAAPTKCYGIAAAGESDCANAVAGHSSSGPSKADYDGHDWKAVKDADACTARGGRTEPFDGRNPNKA